MYYSESRSVNGGIVHSYGTVFLHHSIVIFRAHPIHSYWRTRFGNTYYIDEHYTRMSPMNLSFIRGMRKLANKAK